MRWLFILLGAAALCGAADLRRAPGFSLPDMKLKQHDAQDYRGKVVLIDFMRTGCPKCQELSRNLEEVKAKFAERVVVLTVVNPPDNQTTVGQYVAANKVTGPVLFDCGQMTASYLRVTPAKPQIHLPQLVIIDGGGMIRNEIGPESNPLELGSKALSSTVDELLRKR